MKACIYLTDHPTQDQMKELMDLLRKYPHIHTHFGLRDGVYVFLEDTDELFERERIKESAKLTAKEELNNPSRRKKNESL